MAIDAYKKLVRNALKKTGDAMIGGDLTLYRDPSEAMHAATKQYVDANAGGDDSAGFPFGVAYHPLDSSDWAAATVVDIFFPGIVAFGTISVGSFNGNILRARPFILKRDITIDKARIRHNANNVAGAEIRYGIYTNKSPMQTRWYPDQLLVDFGPFDLSAGAPNMKEITGIATSVSVSAGPMFWIAEINSHNTPTVSQAPSDCFMPFGSTSSSIPDLRVGLTVNQAYGALPATFPTGGTGATGNWPIVALVCSA